MPKILEGIKGHAWMHDATVLVAINREILELRMTGGTEVGHFVWRSQPHQTFHLWSPVFMGPRCIYQVDIKLSYDESA